MLPPKVIAAVIFIWVVGAFIGGLFELASVDSADESLLNNVLFFNLVTTEGSWGPMQIAAQAGDFLESLWRMATFQFSFITGEWELVRWFVFIPLTGMLVYGFVFMVIGILRGTLGSS